MITQQFKDISLPMLGIGTMRLPTIDGDYSKIDEEHIAEMFGYAMEHGANYFDTAWGYHDGNSEEVTGRLLKAYPRNSYYLATKFPGYSLSNMDKVEEIFEEQINRCKVDYFDFYLIHNVCEMNINEYLDESYGIMKYLLQQKESGRLKHLGFSAHGTYETTKRFLDAYGEHLEFGQLQLNWLDWKFQKAEESVQLLRERGIALWAMEPMRGGKLASVDAVAEAALRKLRPEESIPSWAFRFLQTIPNLTMILTGASSLEQLKENIAAFAEPKPLNDEELAALQNIADSMLSETSLPCTECRYCVSECPQELDIPWLIGLYNQRNFTGKEDFISSMSLSVVSDDKKPSACTACRSCEEVCPQQLKIADAMADFAEAIAEA